MPWESEAAHSKQTGWWKIWSRHGSQWGPCLWLNVDMLEMNKIKRRKFKKIIIIIKGDVTNRKLYSSTSGAGPGHFFQQQLRAHLLTGLPGLVLEHTSIQFYLNSTFIPWTLPQSSFTENPDINFKFILDEQAWGDGSNVKPPGVKRGRNLESNQTRKESSHLLGDTRQWGHRQYKELL